MGDVNVAIARALDATGLLGSADEVDVRDFTTELKRQGYEITAQTPEPATQQPRANVVEALQIELDRQSEEQDEWLPSSIARDRGLAWLHGWYDLHSALIAALRTQAPEPRANVVEALRELANCEKTYRYKRDLCGDGHSETRCARNEMRSAGNKARVLLLALRTQAPASDVVRDAVIEARIALVNWSKYESEKDELAYQGNKVANALETILEALGAKP